jgi:Ala-tRNA(Pro) deacylase
MAVAITLEQYLSDHNIDYKLVEHKATSSTLDSAKASHIPPAKVSKAVVLQSDQGNYLLASVPANSRVSLTKVDQMTGEHFHLVSERALLELFPDCQRGAVPAAGTPYRLKMLIDDSLLKEDAIYLESGDHQHLVQLDQQNYHKLVGETGHGAITGIVLGQHKHFSKTNSELLSEMLTFR